MQIPPGESEPHKSGYRAMVNSLRASLVDEHDRLYFLHTPVGTINVSTWNYSQFGHVAVTGVDENGAYRFVVFSEETIRHFPFEIGRKSQESAKEIEIPQGKEPIGFKPPFRGSSEDHV
jgi:hypothetical protein